MHDFVIRAFRHDRPDFSGFFAADLVDLFGGIIAQPAGDFFAGWVGAGGDSECGVCPTIHGSSAGSQQ
jgi:hypothetical protein